MECGGKPPHSKGPRNAQRTTLNGAALRRAVGRVKNGGPESSPQFDDHAAAHSRSLDEDLLRLRLRRLRREGQRLRLLPAALLQPGARPARVVGRVRHHDRALRRRASSIPLVGYVSDHLQSPLGAATPVHVRVGACRWRSRTISSGIRRPDCRTARCSRYFVALAILVRILIACYEIPSSSLVAELTDHYDERTSILSYRFFFGWWGGLTMAVLAYAVFLQPDAEHPVGVLNPDGYRTLRAVGGGDHGDGDPHLGRSARTRYIPYLRQPPDTQHARRGAARCASSARRWPIAPSSPCSGPASSAAWRPASRRRSTIYFNTYFWELTSHADVVTGAAELPVRAAIAFAVAPQLSVRFGKNAPRPSPRRDRHPLRPGADRPAPARAVPRERLAAAAADAGGA